MTDDPAFLWDTTRSPRSRPTEPSGESALAGAPQAPGHEAHRITLRDASARYGIAVGTLRGWAKEGRIDATKDDRGWWMADPASVAAEVARSAPTPPVSRAPGPAPAATGPTEDGSAMLVPRDAWDRLIDQLGNLHEAGLMLAEARERAVKAETEAAFLRERLADLRAERDALRDSPDTPAHPAAGPSAERPKDTPGIAERARDWLDRLRR